MSNERFLGRNNLIQGAWAIVIALICFVAGTMTNFFTGPPTVVVQTPVDDPVVRSEDRQTETLLEIARLQQELSVEIVDYQKDLYALITDEMRQNEGFIREMQALNAILLESSNRPEDEQTRAELGRISQQLENVRKRQIEEDFSKIKEEIDLKKRNSELSESIDRLAEMVEQNTTHGTGAAIRSAGSGVRFQLPKSAIGYQPTSLIDVKMAKCPEKILDTDATIHISFYVSDSSLTDRASPLVMKIIRLKDDESYALQVFERAYPIKAGLNDLVESVDLAPGDYHFSYGFFLWEELNSEYPKYYSKNCKFSVRDSS